MNIPRVDFTLQTITPLFLSGTEQTPELRPPSVRGALRYWLRTLTDASDISQLRESESAVFGQTDFGSPVIVRMNGTPTQMTNFDLDRDPQKENKHGQKRQLETGLNYLYYSTKLGSHKPDGNNRVPFKPAESVTLSLQLSPAYANGMDLLLQASKALWCLTNLGGLGMRARRCAGNLKITAYRSSTFDEQLKVLFPDSAPANLTNVQTHLQSILQSIKRASATSAYDVIHPDKCRVWVFQSAQKPWEYVQDALDFIGKEMQDFRAAQGATRNTDNAIFGVPILHGPDFGLKRRASPLWLKIGQFSDGKYYGVATLFKANFTLGNPSVGGGYAHIENFITTKLRGTEVIYR